MEAEAPPVPPPLVVIPFSSKSLPKEATAGGSVRLLQPCAHGIDCRCDPQKGHYSRLRGGSLVESSALIWEAGLRECFGPRELSDIATLRVLCHQYFTRVPKASAYVTRHVKTNDIQSWLGVEPAVYGIVDTKARVDTMSSVANTPAVA